jgi:hypothetical protein
MTGRGSAGVVVVVVVVVVEVVAVTGAFPVDAAVYIISIELGIDCPSGT